MYFFFFFFFRLFLSREIGQKTLVDKNPDNW